LNYTSPSRFFAFLNILHFPVPYISSRPGRAGALREIIRYMKQCDGVWFATCSEVAEWWLKQVFPASIAPKARAAAGY